MPDAPATFRDRIRELRRVPAGELKADPANWRRHPKAQRDALRSMLEDIGYAAAAVARETPDGLVLIDGHLRADMDPNALVPVLIVDVDEDEAGRLLATLDPLASMAVTDAEALRELTADMVFTDDALQLVLTGLGGKAVDGLRADVDERPETPAEPITRPGDLWILGRHRLLCADTTDPDAVGRLADGRPIVMLNADPPYGLGKEAEGIANDNLYGSKLDAFQSAWWSAWSPALASNGSAYIWGTAADLWRWWWVGGLGELDLIVRNEIVWDKTTAMGMRSDGQHQFPTGSERCLFVMRGQQFLGSQNQDDYWEGHEPLRAHLDAQRELAGFSRPDVNRITGTQMAGHWFSRSQFQPITRKAYEALREAAGGAAFVEDYDTLYDTVLGTVKEGGNAHRRDLSAQMREARTYFDNTHDTMRDVWQYTSVAGEDRWGHATPKPVAMVARAVASSVPVGGSFAAPFAGTGPEYIAAEELGRDVVGMELEPAYCDVIVARWEKFTGGTAERA